MATKKDKKALQDLHMTALKQFEEIEDRERDQRELAVEDSIFINVEDGQWDDKAKETRKDRPRYTIDRTSPAIDQLVGDQRQNRTSIKVQPTTGGASKEGADLRSGLIRNIEERSKASQAHDIAYDETITGGYGGWRILTEFNDDDSFDQDIFIKPIRSAATSLFFGRSEEYDKRDAKFAFLITDVDKEQFKKDNPDISITDFSNNLYTDSYCQGWFQDNTIRVAEYWIKTPITKHIALLSDDRVIDMDEEKDVLDEIKDLGIEIVKERKVKSHKVQMYKMNGAEIYSGPHEWAGKYIPLVPCYGKVSVIDGKEYVRGLVRKAKDSQRIYNYETSTKVEVGALSPLDPYFYTPTQVDGFKDEYENFRTSNTPFMPYNPDPEAPGPPVRSGAPSVQAAMMDSIKQAENDLFMVTMMGPPALGMNPGLQSGVALKRQDEKGDRGSFIFSDNLSKSIQYEGDILLDLIPRIYDTERVVRVLNLDGSSEEATLNQEAMDDLNQPIIDKETGKQVIVNDLKSGKYDSTVDTGPAYSTQREESAAQLIELAAASPRFEAIATDLIAKNLNVLESEELTKRIRKGMIIEGIVDPTDDEVEEFDLLNQPEPPPDPQMVLVQQQQQVEAEKLQLERDKFQLEEDKTAAELDDKDADRQLKARELALKEREAELKQADKDLSLRETQIKAQADVRIAEINAASKDKETDNMGRQIDNDGKREPVEQKEAIVVNLPEINVHPPSVDVTVDNGGNKKISIERKPDGSLTGETKDINQRVRRWHSQQQTGQY